MPGALMAATVARCRVRQSEWAVSVALFERPEGCCLMSKGSGGSPPDVAEAGKLWQTAATSEPSRSWIEATVQPAAGLPDYTLFFKASPWKFMVHVCAQSWILKRKPDPDIPDQTALHGLQALFRIRSQIHKNQALRNLFDARHGCGSFFWAVFRSPAKSLTPSVG